MMVQKKWPHLTTDERDGVYCYASIFSPIIYHKRQQMTPCTEANVCPFWPRGWAYLSLPLLTWQRLDTSTVLVEWHDADISTDPFDTSIEYNLNTSTTFERVRHLFDVVLTMASFTGGIEIIIDTHQMSYTFASLHLNDWVKAVWRSPGWERVRRCHIVTTGAIMPTLIQLAVADHPRIHCHENLEAACGACDVDPELVV